MTNIAMQPTVYFNAQYQQWHARIYHRYKYIHVGRFDDRDIALASAKQKIAELERVQKEQDEKQSQARIWSDAAAASRMSILAKYSGGTS
ncbi:hypothetical protein DVS77_21665 [Mycolicibacterium moriokaense]|nr:hypothetical protein DVS77_21665 [Mycolicibacterium moriokaense]